MDNYADSIGVKSSDRKKPTLVQAGILYSVSVLLLMFIGSRVQKREFYTGILITEILLIALPAVILLAVNKYNFRQVLRLHKVSILNLFLIFLAMVFAIPLVGVLNLINYLLIKNVFGKVMIQQPPAATTLTGLVMSILVIGASAGICEEILFRGTIMRAFEKFGAVKAILITALLFGLLHLDFQKLLGTFLLGALIGFIVYRTDSLFSGMFAHFTNNSVAVVTAFWMYKMNEMLRNSGFPGARQAQSGDFDFSALLNLPREQLMATVIVWIFILLFCAIVFTGVMIGFYHSTRGKAEKMRGEAVTAGSVNLLWFIPGLAVIVSWYYLQGLSLLEIKLQWMESLFRFLGFK